MPLSNSSTGTLSLTVRNMRDPGACQAFCETPNGCTSVICFWRSASKTTYAVKSLVSDAGSTRSSGLRAAAFAGSGNRLGDRPLKSATALERCSQPDLGQTPGGLTEAL